MTIWLWWATHHITILYPLRNTKKKKKQRGEKMENLNKIYIVGTLTEVELRKGSKDGKDYVGGSCVITSNGQPIEVKFYSSLLKKDNTVNKKYQNIIDLEGMKGRRVTVNGELTSRAFYQVSAGQTITFNEINAGFFNLAKDTVEDVATFEFAGYVMRPLYERLNKEEQLIAYEMEIGQADYTGENLRAIRFTVDKDSPKIVSAIQSSYTKGATVSINGEIRYQVNEIEKKEEVAFGEPIVKKFTNVIKTFLITGGKPVIMTEAAYTPAQINALELAHAEYLKSVEEDAKKQAQSGQVAVTPAPSKGTTKQGLL